MTKIFKNNNGNQYFILFGKQGEQAFLCSVDCKQYVICEQLNEESWYYGKYFYNFEDAYKFWKNELQKKGE